MKKDIYWKIWDSYSGENNAAFFSCFDYSYDDAVIIYLIDFAIFPFMDSDELFVALVY